MAHQILTPRREEGLLDGGRASHRYVRFFEEIANVSNTSASQLGTTVVVGGTYTTAGAVTIICTGITVIMLNANPEDRERVTANRTNGTVTVNGNGKLINTDTTQILTKDETSLDFFFSLAQNQWYIV